MFDDLGMSQVSGKRQAAVKLALKSAEHVTDFVANFRYGNVPASSQPASSLNDTCITLTTSHGLFYCIAESAARFGIDCAMM